MKLDDQLQIGARVRVDLVDIPKKERQCETGIIRRIDLRFPKVPQLTEVRYTVLFDRPYIKPECVLIGNIPEITCSRESITPVKSTGTNEGETK